MFKNVLIVDDSKTARFQLKKLLTQRNLAVEAFGSAQEVLAYLAAGNMPDIIFMDHMMPEMDGFEATQQIRANPKTRDLPVILCTGKDHAGYLEEAVAIGASQILPKPPESDQLDAILAGANLITPPRAAPVELAPAVRPATASPPPSFPPAELAELLARITALEARPLPPAPSAPALDQAAVTARVDQAIQGVEARLETRLQAAVADQTSRLGGQMASYASAQELAQIRDKFNDSAERISQLTAQHDGLSAQIEAKLAEQRSDLPQQLEEQIVRQSQTWEDRIEQRISALRDALKSELAQAAPAPDEPLDSLVDARLAELSAKIPQQIDEQLATQRQALERELDMRVARLRRELVVGIEKSVIAKVLAAAPDEEIDKDFLLEAVSHDWYEEALRDFAEEKRELEQAFNRQQRQLWLTLGVAAVALVAAILL